MTADPNSSSSGRRLAIVGASGTGKTTLARELHRRLGVTHLELDAMFHQPGWTELEDDEFRRRVGAFIDEHESWVIDGNYRRVQNTIFRRADTVVWLDLDRRTYMPSLVKRTLGRAITREELWNGNRERLADVISTDPGRSIIAWSWSKQREYRAKYERKQHDPRWAHLTWIRLRTRLEVAEWLAAVDS